MKSDMYIPKTITVGYQNRDDTYTGKLAYVVYTDDKGVLRKEKSWQSWRSAKLGRDEFPNEPTSGFVLNKKVGGYKAYFDVRQTYVRVYDPRNFEFEITVPNLLYILQECSAIKGKGLEGEFVYAWKGTELVLLPVGSNEYVECVKHTARQAIKFDKKDIKEGFSYIMKDGAEVMYLGRHNFNNSSHYNKNRFVPLGKKHVFKRLKKKLEYAEERYIAQPGFTKIAECTSPAALPQYPDDLDEFKKSEYCGDYKSLKLTKVPFKENFNYGGSVLLKEKDGYYAVGFHYNWYYNGNQSIRLYKSPVFTPELRNNAVIIPAFEKSESLFTKEEMSNKEFYTVSVVTEKGKSLRV